MAVRLEQLRDQIKKEVRSVGIKPYSHNIISLGLRLIAEGFGKAEANRAIRDFKLDKKGWSEEPENE